jgi:hypothetical protein
MRLKARKDVRGIRTMSDRISDAEKPQRKYIKLALLEMERVRRSKEKHRAAERIDGIDQRLAEIDREQADLLSQSHVVHLGEFRPAGNGPHGRQDGLQADGDITLSY